MVKTIDKRSGKKPGEQPHIEAESITEYFAPEKRYKPVTRGEFASLLTNYAKMERTKRWYWRLWCVVTGRMSIPSFFRALEAEYDAVKAYVDARQPKVVKPDVEPPETAAG